MAPFEHRGDMNDLETGSHVRLRIATQTPSPDPWGATAVYKPTKTIFESAASIELEPIPRTPVESRSTPPAGAGRDLNETARLA